MNKSYTSRKKTNTGFTLAETLLTVAILTILMGIAFVNVVSMQKSMNQLQADKQARILFQEAEQRMNEISAYDEVFREKLSGLVDTENYTLVVNSSLNDNKGSKHQPRLLYLKTDEEVQQDWLTSLDLSEEYDSYQYIIEYQPVTLDVTGVFVTEGDLSFYGGKESVDNLRASSEKRMEYVKTTGYSSSIGYYGLSREDKEEIKPVPVIADSPILCDAVLEDGDELKAVFHATIPDNKDISEVSSNGYYVHATVESVDGSKVAAFRASIPASAFKKDGEDVFNEYREAEFSITIDGTGNDAFKNTFGQAATAGRNVKTSVGNVLMGGTSTTKLINKINTVDPIKIEYDSYNSKYPIETPNSFTPGENIVITAYAEPIPNEGEGIQSSDTERTTGNSLFASATLDDENGTVYKATISNARHLQNLDTATSGFNITSLGNSASLMTAVMADDIIAAEVQTDETDDAEDTGDIQTATINELTSITNEKLTSFNGGKYSIEGFTITPRAGETAGLFSVFSGSSISNVTMKSCVIAGSNNDSQSSGGEPYRSGGLIGTWNIKSGKNTLNGCSMQGVRVFGGKNVGGLVGGIPTSEGTVTIENCNLYMRAGVDFDDDLTADKITKENNNLWLSGSQFAGGLVGATDVSLTISDSYAATVVNGGTQAGGLVGMAADNVTLNVTKSYADCYISAPTIGGLAGSCANDSTFKSCYSAGFVLNPTANTVAAKFVPNENIKFNNGSISKSYSYFSFYDITKAVYDGSDDVEIDRVYPTDGTIYRVSSDKSHRKNNGFSDTDGRDADVSDMQYVSIGDEDVSYGLADYFKAKGTGSFTGARAGLPHYGDFCIEPDEYYVKVKDPKNGENVVEYEYRSGADNPRSKVNISWESSSEGYRSFTTIENDAQAIDSYFTLTTESVDNLISGYMGRNEFTSDGEGVWRLTRYVLWEPTYTVLIYDEKATTLGYYNRNKAEQNYIWQYQGFFGDWLNDESLSDFLFEYISNAGYMNNDGTGLEFKNYVDGVNGNKLIGIAAVNSDETVGSTLTLSVSEFFDKDDENKGLTLDDLNNDGWFMDENRIAKIRLIWEEESTP